MWRVPYRVVSIIVDCSGEPVKKFAGRQICLFHSSQRREIGGARVVARLQALENQCPHVTA